jgi:hypothetical protein
MIATPLETSEDLDNAFLCDLEEMCFSQSRFALAELRQDANLIEHAGAVVTWRGGRFVSIGEIYTEIGKQYRSQIYEVWALEIAAKARSLAKTLEPIASDALLVCSQAEANVTLEEVRAALAEAREELYGNWWDEL